MHPLMVVRFMTRLTAGVSGLLKSYSARFLSLLCNPHCMIGSGISLLHWF